MSKESLKEISKAPVWGDVEAMEFRLFRCIFWVWFSTCFWTIANSPFGLGAPDDCFTSWAFVESEQTSSALYLVIKGEGDGHFLIGLGDKTLRTFPIEPLLVRHGLLIILPSRLSLSLFGRSHSAPFSGMDNMTFCLSTPLGEVPLTSHFSWSFDCW